MKAGQYHPRMITVSPQFVVIIRYVSDNRAVDVGGSGGGGDGTMELGSRSSLHSGLPLTEDEHWEMNYHEAAIYLEVITTCPASTLPTGCKHQCGGGGDGTMELRSR